MKKENWIWMPHAGHFIMGHSCRFRLNTYVGKYIVSTVGELWPDSRVREIYANSRKIDLGDSKGDLRDAKYFEQNGYEEIGSQRTYETMVFKAKKNDTKMKCCPYLVSNHMDLDMLGYNSPEEALKGHMQLCLKWSKK